MARTHDIRLKVSDETRAYLKWHAECSAVDMNEHASDILHDFALNELRKIRLANEILEGEGLQSMVQPRRGIAGK